LPNIQAVLLPKKTEKKASGGDPMDDNGRAATTWRATEASTFNGKVVPVRNEV
jgi:hypothetical protein